MTEENPSSIPVAVDERMTETHPDGRKRRAEYLLDGTVYRMAA